MDYFDIANREVDQDHFIEWLILSYDSENELEKYASINFLELLIGKFENDEHIIQAKVRYQVDLKGSGKIDFICGIKTSKNQYLLAIEDKVDASVDNDLNAYGRYIADNKNELSKKVGVSDNAIMPIFAIIKTGIHLSKSDEAKINNSDFKLVNRNMFSDCLREFGGHYLIGSFLKKISKEYSRLTDFSGKKDILCEHLSGVLNCPVEFKDTKYYVYLNDMKDYYLSLNDFSLSNPCITLYVVGKTAKKISSDYYKLIKNSKYMKRASKKITIDSNLSSLIEFLKMAMTKAF